jgi:hypothetical protein
MSGDGVVPRHGVLETTMEAFLDRTRTVAELMAAAGRGALGVMPEPVPSAVTRMLGAMRQLSEQMPPVTAELDVLVDEVHAKRLSIQALQAELAALDAQLAVLERTLAPVQDWTRHWERLRTSLAVTLTAQPDGSDDGPGES